MEANQRMKKLSIVIFAVMVAMFVVFFVYLGFNENISIFSPRYSPYYGRIINLTPETVKDDTAPMGQRTVYSWLMDAHCETGDYLCFYVSNHHVDITVEQELIYSLHSSDEDAVGRSVSSNWCIIPLAPEDAGKRFTVVLTPLISEILPVEVEFLVGSNYNIVLGQLHQDAPQLILAMMCVALGLIIFLIQCYLQIFSGASQWDQMFMGVFSMILGIWRITAVRSAPLIFSGNPKVLGYVSVGMLFLASPALIQFVSTHFQERQAGKAHILTMAVSAVGMLALVRQVAGTTDMGESRIWGDVALAVSMVMVLVASISGGKSRTPSKNQLTWKLLPLLALGIALDFMVYYFSADATDLVYTCLFFLIYLSITFIANFRETSRMVYRDARTGLFNKAKWNELMLSDASVEEGCGILVLDLNGLKTVNDTYGHEAGDRMILAFADILRNALPFSSMICRWGGDEFTVLLQRVDREKMDHYMEAIFQTAEEYNNAGPEVEIHFAMGGVHSEEYPDINRAELFRLADRRMYENKQRWYAERQLKS